MVEPDDRAYQQCKGCEPSWVLQPQGQAHPSPTHHGRAACTGAKVHQCSDVGLAQSRLTEEQDRLPAQAREVQSISLHRSSSTRLLAYDHDGASSTVLSARITCPYLSGSRAAASTCALRRCA